MLDKLPAEILRPIIYLVNNRQDLLRLCLVSKIIYYWAHPRLFESINVKSRGVRHHEFLDVEPILERLDACSGAVKCIKSLQIGAKVDSMLRDRFICYGAYPFDTNWENHVTQVANSLLPLLRRLVDNSLESFQWNLGACTPLELLGESGYLPSKQSQIKSLSLITNAECATGNASAHVTHRLSGGLSKLRSLKVFSWRGLWSIPDFLGLDDVLKCNAGHLEELELDLVDWHRARKAIYKAIMYRPAHFLNMLADSKVGRVELRSLQLLSLSGYHFEGYLPEMVSPLNLSNLRSLTLRRCHGYRDVLQGLTNSSLPIRLTSLELVDGDHDLIYNHLVDEIPSFLKVFHGLERLRLLVWGDLTFNLRLWEAILHHQSTLKELIHHERRRNLQDWPDKVGLPWGTTEDGFVPVDSSTPFLKLEYVALCCTFSQIRSHPGPLASHKALRVLHIRKPSSIVIPEHEGVLDTNALSLELESFARWAFGPDGFPKLQVLACGDFSRGGRFSEHNTLFCRRPVTAHDTSGLPRYWFRKMLDSDWDRLGHTDAAALRAMLEACPEDLLLRFRPVR